MGDDYPALRQGYAPCYRMSTVAILFASCAPGDANHPSLKERWLRHCKYQSDCERLHG